MSQEQEIGKAGRNLTGRIFAVKTTGGQEKSVAEMISIRNKIMKKPIYSILVLGTLKGYVFVEASNAQVVGESIAGFKHVKSQIPGVIQFQDIEKFLTAKPVITELGVGDVVEVVGGPFKSMRAKVTRVETLKSEVTVILLDAPYQLPVTIQAEDLRLTEKAHKL